MKSAVTLASGLLVFLLVSPVSAEIAGFTVNKIDGSGSLEGQLNDRMADNYKINFSDCLAYLGDYSQTDTTGDVVSVGSGVAPRFVVRWSITAVSGYDYSVKVGNCSDTGGIADEETDACRYVVSKTSLESYTNNELVVDFTDLLVDGCTEGSSGDTSLYFFIQYADDTTTKKVEVVKFSYDFEAPLTPTELTVVGGENNLKVSWVDDLNSDDVTYRLYWSDAEFTENGLDELKSKGDLSAKSYQIGGLEVGTTYYVGVVATDAFDNESTLSKLQSGAPIVVSDFWENYKASGGQEEGGFCFVATAAWGSSMAGAVPTLRHFRDGVLLTSAWGRRLVSLYYLNSPALAQFISERPGLRLAARVALAPVFAVAWFSVEANGIDRFRVLLMMASMVVMTLGLRRRAATAGRRV